MTQPELVPQAPSSDPSARIIVCEIARCGVTMRLGDSFSFVGGLATTGPNHVLPHQCPQEQHFACSLEHAFLAHRICLEQHVIPEHKRRVAEHLNQLKKGN